MIRPADILGNTFDCECGKRHVVPIETVVYSDDAVARCPDVCAGIAQGTSATLIADSRTFTAAGNAVASSLERSGWNVRTCLLPDPSRGDPICDDLTKDWLQGEIGDPGDLIVAVGSGVVNDLSKWVATEARVPYVVFATAASMNGYSSEIIAPAVRGVKCVLPGTVPRAILTTPAVIASAPDRLTAAGLGDVLAKPVSMTDWQINHLLFDEYYCPLCARLIRDMEPLYMNHPEGIREKTPGTLKALFQALVYSGLSMTLAGTTFPASGGEHLVSHVLDMIAMRDGILHDYHGRQVGLGTIFASALYERLLAIDTPPFRVVTEETDATFWTSLTDVVEEQHTLKRVRVAGAAARLMERDTWNRVREHIRRGMVSAGRVKDCLRRAGAASQLDDIGCTRQQFVQAALRCHQIRDRYTVVDLARAAGILPQAAGDIVDQYLGN